MLQTDGAPRTILLKAVGLKGGTIRFHIEGAKPGVLIHREEIFQKTGEIKIT